MQSKQSKFVIGAADLLIRMRHKYQHLNQHDHEMITKDRIISISSPIIHVRHHFPSRAAVRLGRCCTKSNELPTLNEAANCAVQGPEQQSIVISGLQRIARSGGKIIVQLGEVEGRSRLAT